MLAPPVSPTWLESKYSKGSEPPTDQHNSLSIYKYAFSHNFISLWVTDKATTSSPLPLEHVARTRIIGKEAR